MKNQIQWIDENLQWEQMDDYEKRCYVFSRGFYEPRFFVDYFLEKHTLKARIKWSEEERAKWAETGKVPRYPSPKFHFEIWEKMDRGFSVTMVPRGFGKSSIGKFRMIQKIAYGGFHSHMTPPAEYQYGKTYGGRCTIWMPEKLGLKTMQFIRDEFEHNEKIIWIFGDLIPDVNKSSTNKRFTQDILQFNNGVEIERVAKQGAVRGGRNDELWGDDVQENIEVENPDRAEKYWDHFNTSLAFTMNPGGRIHITGTNIGIGSVIDRLMQDGTGVYQKTTYQGVRNMEQDPLTKKIISGEPLWPERFDLKAMELMRLTFKERAFMQEIQNIPMPASGYPAFPTDLTFKVVPPTFSEKGVEYFTELKNDVPKAEKNIIIAVDPAEGYENGDNTAIVGLARDGRLLFQFRGKMNQPDTANLLDHIITRRGFHGIVIVERNMGSALVSAILGDIGPGYWWGTQMMSMDIKFDSAGRSKFTNKYGVAMSEQLKRAIIQQTTYVLEQTSDKILGIELTESEKKSMDYVKKTRLFDRTGLMYKVNLAEVSKEIVEEIETFYVKDNGKKEAVDGYHDDLLMAFMIAWHGKKTPGRATDLPSRKIFRL